MVGASFTCNSSPKTNILSVFILCWSLVICSLVADIATASPLVDFTAPALVNELGGKESHIYPWGTGADQRRATRSGMGYIVFTGNGQKLTTVSTVVGFTSKETGAANVGGPENFYWFLRVEPINSTNAGTWFVEQFWNTSSGAYAASTVPGALDLSFPTVVGSSPQVGTFIGVNLRKITVDASSANYVLQAGQLYRLVLIPWTQEPTPPGCTSANPACITQLVALPGLSFARDGGINNTGAPIDSYYQTLLEYRSYGTSKYGTGTTQWYGGRNSAIGLEGPNWAYDVEVPCVDTDGPTNSINPSVTGTVTTSQGSYKDYCVMRYNLIEMSCNANGDRVQQVISCPKGCSAGRCL